MEYYFVLSFREILSDGSGYNLHIVPNIQTPGNCVFECYGAYVYENGENDVFKFSYEISCINSFIQQIKLLFNMWKSQIVVELHQMKLHKNELLNYFKIESKMNKTDLLWRYQIDVMKNKTCKQLLLSIVNA